MQNSNHFVTYIYSYEQNVKHRNAGFAKIDYRGEIVRMEAQIKAEFREKEAADFCLLVKEAEQILAIPIAEMRFEKGVANYKGRFFAKKLGKSNYHFEDVTGFYIKTKREIFASQWLDEELKISQITMYKEQKEEVVHKQSRQPEKKQKENVQQKNTQSESPKEEAATIKATEIKAAETKDSPYDWRYEWEKLDQNTGNELVFGLALWTRNKGKS